MSEPLVVVGNGMAAARFVDELSRRGLGRYSVMVVGWEPVLAYNRVLLSSLLAGEVDEAALELKPRSWWVDRGVSIRYGDGATAIDLAQRRVTLQSGIELPYAKLVLATGSSAIKLPIAGMDLPGVVTFRDRDDVEAMRLAPGKRAVVIGGGLLGLEAAAGLAKAGVLVTLVHLMDRLMERQLDTTAGALLARAVEARGIEVLLEAHTACVTGTTRATGIDLKDGRHIEADLVVCAIGVRPQVSLAKQAGLDVGRGIKIDDTLTTSDPTVFALGECAEHRDAVYGLVEPAYEQAKVLAARLAGDKTALYLGSKLATNLKVSGIGVFSAGDFTGSSTSETILYEDEETGAYRKIVIEGDTLAGSILMGDTSDALWHLGLIRSGADISTIRGDLAFGRFEEAEAA